MKDQILLQYQQRLDDLKLIQSFRKATGNELLELHLNTCQCKIKRAVSSFWFHSDLSLEEHKDYLNNEILRFIDKVKIPS